MKKLNKKGFTLVEMLVVIAIIAVLVAIIIPTTSSATTKAAAATNAANLRSLLAEATTDYLSGVADDTGYVKVEVADDGTITLSARSDAPASKKCGDFIGKDVPAVVSNTGNVITVNYGTGKDIDYFSAIADTGKAPSAAPAGGGTTTETE